MSDMNENRRRDAETVLAGRARTSYEIAPEKLLHELEVHQIELEMQNEELAAARDELTASLARYTELYDFAPVGFFTITSDSFIRQLNLAAAALLGREPAVLQGALLRSFVTPDAQSTFNVFLSQVLASDSKQSCELSLCGAGGPIVAHVEALSDRNHRECRLAVIDITEHKRGAAIRESEQRFQVALANSPVTVFEQDRQRRYTWIHNPMLGFRVDQVIGRRNGDLMDADSARRLDYFIREVISSDRPNRIEISIAAPGRETICWDLSLHPRHDVNGRLMGVIGAAMNITERKHAEQALQAAKNESERADNAKSRFLAAASHDLRQPLGALALYVDIMKGKVAAKDAVLVEHIKGCVTSMSTLLNDLLDVSKLTAGVVRAQPADFSVDDMLAQVVTVHAPEAELKGLRLRHLPCGLTAHTDPIWFERMIGNLVANAVEYTEHGGVLIACRRRLGRMWVEIRDTGVGIREHQTAEIFEEFRQLDDTARTHGSGLGLAIVAKAAALLNLQIRVRSRVGKGSLFAVELPLGLNAEQALPANTRAEESKPLRIALVEDNAAVLQALCCLFETSGHEVVAASSQQDLLESLDGMVPDIVISDYRLPDNETGFDVINGVRKTFGKELPAIIITGDTDPGIMADMSRHGIVIQHKPINVATLESCIAEATK